MPCNSDYLEPSEVEADSKRVCGLLLYALTSLNRPIDTWIVKGATDLYGSPDKLDEAVILLCSTCTSMTKGQATRIIYDAYSKKARALAEWWEEHQAADREREENDADRARRHSLRKSALAKLTEEERDAIGA